MGMGDQLLFQTPARSLQVSGPPGALQHHVLTRRHLQTPAGCSSNDFAVPDTGNVQGPAGHSSSTWATSECSGGHPASGDDHQGARVGFGA